MSGFFYFFIESRKWEFSTPNEVEKLRHWELEKCWELKELGDHLNFWCSWLDHPSCQLTDLQYWEPPWSWSASTQATHCRTCSYPGVLFLPHHGHWTWVSWVATLMLKSQLACILLFGSHSHLNISLASLRHSTHKNYSLNTVFSLSYYHSPSYSANTSWSIFILLSLQTLLSPGLSLPFPPGQTWWT